MVDKQYYFYLIIKPYHHLSLQHTILSVPDHHLDLHPAHMNQTKQYILEKMIDGLKDDERLFQNYIYGKADLIFPVKSFFKTLYYNMCDFFFIFQAFAILLWFNNLGNRILLFRNKSYKDN